jgi:DNA mismatch repair protein MutS2
MGIKGFVHRTKGMLNASMEFNQKTLSPLYRLRVGEPGQSHAIEIAQKYGLPEHVVKSARELLGGAKIELDAMIADLNEKRGRYEALLHELSLREAQVVEIETGVREMLRAAEVKQKEVLADAQREALDIISEMKRQLRAELDAMKRMEKKELREKLKEIEQKQKDAAEKLAGYELEKGEVVRIEDVKVGDTVFVKSLGYDGSVAGIMTKANRLKIVAGSKEILVPVSDIRIRKGREIAEKARETGASRAAPDEIAPSRINLVGLRVDEALSVLEPFLNHAALAGFGEVTIVHGVGTGALSRAVREHLKDHPLIKSFRPGESSEGGAGVTVAIFE